MFSLNENFAMLLHGKAGKHSLEDNSILNDLQAVIDSIAANGPEAAESVLLPGFTQMHNIHPLIVHFPIALLSLFCLFDFFGSLFGVASWRKAAGWFLYTGAISTVLAVFAGLQAAASVPHNEIVHLILQKHQFYGFTVAGMSIFLSLWRLLASSINAFGNVVYQLLSIGMFCMLVLGADLGGLMVFKHGVATHLFTDMSNHDHKDGHSHQH